MPKYKSKEICMRINEEDYETQIHQEKINRKL